VVKCGVHWETFRILRKEEGEKTKRNSVYFALEGGGKWSQFLGGAVLQGEQKAKEEKTGRFQAGRKTHRGLDHIEKEPSPATSSTSRTSYQGKGEVAVLEGMFVSTHGDKGKLN